MPRKLLQFTVLALAVPALSACLAQSRIQAKYMSHESECRDEAEAAARKAQRNDALAPASPNPAPPKTAGEAAATATPAVDPTYVIGAAFSECMNREGWKVTVPKPPGTPPGPIATGPTLPPSGAPGPGGTVALKSPAVEEPPAAAPILGPGVQPNPAQVFKSAPAPQQGGPSTYQPGRPDGTDAPEYGTGVGRQF